MADGSSDDYYALFGIAVNADASQLRRAWRRLALRWHPDRAGPGATATFQTLLAAYTVLSDPVARRAYDRRRSARLRAAGTPPTANSTTPPIERRRQAPAVMLGRLSGSLSALLASGVAEQAPDGVIELFLTGQEAADGGMATISMRVAVRCPACAAAGGPCLRCETERVIEELYSAWLAVPPGVADGAILTPSVGLQGMLRPVSFRVRRDSRLD